MPESALPAWAQGLLVGLGKPLPFAFLAPASLTTFRVDFFAEAFALACIAFLCFFLVICRSLSFSYEKKNTRGASKTRPHSGYLYIVWALVPGAYSTPRHSTLLTLTPSRAFIACSFISCESRFAG